MGSTARPLAWLVLLSACLWALPAEAGEMPQVWHRDPVHKFSLRVFKDWGQVPLEPGEKLVVAKFCEGGEKGRFVPPELEVVRVNTNPETDKPTITGSGGEEIEIPEELR